MKTLRHAAQRLLALAAAALLLGGCTGERLTGPEAEPSATAAEASTAAKHSQNSNGPSAWVIRDNQLCFLPGIAPDGTPYPLDDIPCQVQYVGTRNGRNIANAWVKAVVPNESGRAVKLTFGNPEPIPCHIEFDFDGDGTVDFFRDTTRYTFIDGPAKSPNLRSRASFFAQNRMFFELKLTFCRSVNHRVRLWSS